jgi:hypothetical protein
VKFRKVTCRHNPKSICVKYKYSARNCSNAETCKEKKENTQPIKKWVSEAATEFLHLIPSYEVGKLLHLSKFMKSVHNYVLCKC